MVTIHVKKQTDSVILAVAGELDGSGAWRVVRLALRLARANLVFIDLSRVVRMLTFGAAVLAHGLARATATVISVRPEHRRLLAAEGLDADTLADDDLLEAEPAA